MEKLKKIYLKKILELTTIFIFSILLIFLFSFTKNVVIIVFVSIFLFIANLVYTLPIATTIISLDKETKYSIEKELIKPIYDSADVILTKNYIIVLNNLHTIRYSDIKSIHKKHRISIYTLILYDEIIIIDKENKKTKIPITNVLPIDINDYAKKIIDIIKVKNPNISVEIRK